MAKAKLNLVKTLTTLIALVCIVALVWLAAICAEEIMETWPGYIWFVLWMALSAFFIRICEPLYEWIERHL